MHHSGGMKRSYERRRQVLLPIGSSTDYLINSTVDAQPARPWWSSTPTSEPASTAHP
jgi:hypothetical protein